MIKTTIGGLAAAATMVLAYSPAAIAAPGMCPNAQFLKQAHAAIQIYRREMDFSGALLVAVDGRPALREGVGLADRELGVPDTPLMKFEIGSVTKQFTAAAILQLQEAGKLSIGDPISKYYADAPAAWSKITLRHLLTHTSGIPDYLNEIDFLVREGRLPHTTEQLIDVVRDKPLLFEPGSRFQYGSSGYLLLGHVIEKVSGQSRPDYMQQHILGPLGMMASGENDLGKVLPGRAKGYVRGLDDGIWRNAPFTDPSLFSSAGALYSTVDDLLTWDQALYSARVLKPESLKAMFTDYGHQYGLGWYVDKKWGQDRVSHTGETNGFSAQFQRSPQARIAVIALFNDRTPTFGLATDLGGLCLGAEVYPREAAETPANLKRYAGYYDRNGVSVLKIEPRDGVLATRNFQQGDTHFYPEGAGGFFAKTMDIRIAFQTEADGKVTGLLISRPSLPQPLVYKRIDPAEGERLLATPLAQRMAAAAAKAAQERPAPAAAGGSAKP